MLYLHRSPYLQTVAIHRTRHIDTPQGNEVLSILGTVSKRRFDMPAPVKAETLQYYIADIALPEDADEGEYDYCFQIGGVPLESGLLQIGTYKKKKEEYEGDVEYIEYRG